MGLKIEAGAITSTTIANAIVPVIVSAAQNAIIETAAVGVANYSTTFSTDAADDPAEIIASLADGDITGQLRRFQMIEDGGFNAVLTPATAFNGGATTITFAAVGDVAELMWNGSAWQVLALYNIVDGATAPVLA